MESKKHFTDADRLTNIAKKISSNDNIVAFAKSKVNDIQMAVANFECADIIDESNPNFQELCIFFMQLDDYLIDLDRILSNYRR